MELDLHLLIARPAVFGVTMHHSDATSAASLAEIHAIDSSRYNKLVGLPAWAEKAPG